MSSNSDLSSDRYQNRYIVNDLHFDMEHQHTCESRIIRTPAHLQENIYEAHCNYLYDVNPHDDWPEIGDSMLPPLPALVDLRLKIPAKLTAPRNQGSQASCFAFAASTMKMYHECTEAKLNKQFSPQFIYNMRFNINDSNPNNDWGMYSHDVMNILKNHGCCLEETLPYNRNIGNKSNIPPACFEEAKKYKIKDFAYVQSIDGAKQALLENGPLLFTVPSYNNGPAMWNPGPGQTGKRTGHAMLIVGYSGTADKGSFLVLNSWGPRWNGTGYCRFPYKDWGKHWECITCVDEVLQTKP